VRQITSQHSVIRAHSGDVGITAITTFLIAVTPKCPLCWVALLSSMGVVSTISERWMQPLAVSLLLVSAFALFIRARKRSFYGPFLLGLVAALSMYLCKFRFEYDPGVYVSAITLFASSIWSALPRRTTAETCATCLQSEPLDVIEPTSTLQPKRRPAWLA